MRCTLRQYLTLPHPPITAHPSAIYSNSTRQDAAAEDWPKIDYWEKWTDFTMPQINALLGPVLDAKFEFADPPPFVSQINQIRRERGLDICLSRYNNVIINEALRAACRHLRIDRVVWCEDIHSNDQTIFPDWCASTEQTRSGADRRKNLLPGDSKFTKEPLRAQKKENLGTRDLDNMPVSSPLTVRTEYTQSCLEQVNHYAANYKSRYFYIITNLEIFIARRRLTPSTGTSPAQTRARRNIRITATSQGSVQSSSALPRGSLHLPPIQLGGSLGPSLGPSRESLHSSPIPSPFSSPTPARGNLDPPVGRLGGSLPSSPPNVPKTTQSSSQDSRPRPGTRNKTGQTESEATISPATSASSYVQDTTGDEMPPLECISIKWEDDKDMTVNLALFVLHLLALIENDPREEYDELSQDRAYVRAFQRD
ncbi:MAG: hypothetical protein M1820_006353 [Bogoriella megaspora]|nr:MAG: hypothetical protein M1820_006353 [Bogoriella megaspora]